MLGEAMGLRPSPPRCLYLHDHVHRTHAASSPLKWFEWFSCPDASPRIRLVRPALCLQLAVDSRAPRSTLAVWLTLPVDGPWMGVERTQISSTRALTGTPKNNGAGWAGPVITYASAAAMLMLEAVEVGNRDEIDRIAGRLLVGWQIVGARPVLIAVIHIISRFQLLVGIEHPHR
jgi:hypothetical protein